MRVRNLSAGFALVALVGTGGCEKKAPKVGLVSGTVTIDGKPAARIGVAFFPATDARADDSPVSTGLTDDTGRYELSFAWPPGGASQVRKPGAALGKNRVVLDDNKANAEHSRTTRVPMRYTKLDKSGFELDVKPGQQTFDIPLKSQ